MTDKQPKAWKRSWRELLLILCIVINLAGVIAYRFGPAVDEPRALAYFALAVAFTACLRVEGDRR